MQATKIEWTSFSSNPIKYRDASGKVVWACVKTSPGCLNCYARSTAKRWKRGGPFSLPVLKKLTPFLDEKEIKLLQRSKTISGKSVFVCDMTDFAGEWIPSEMLDTLFAVFALRPDVEFQLLTKRAERICQYASPRRPNGPHCSGTLWSVEQAARKLGRTLQYSTAPGIPGEQPPHTWPPKNILLGFSAENQEWYDKRLPYARQLASLGWRFWWSLEPLLGPIKLAADDPSIWNVCGGESGSGVRPCEIAWTRSIKMQCKASNTPVFVKQLGSVPILSPGRGPTIKARADDEHRQCMEWPDGAFFGNRTGIAALNGYQVLLKDKKGAAMEEWPEDLRIRQTPGATP